MKNQWNYYITLLDHYPGLRPNLKGLGADRENSILNQSCHVISFAMLLQGTRSFVQHFKKYKEDIIKYHVMKGAVRACELSEDNDKLYNNSVEAMNNKLIKHWQN